MTVGSNGHLTFGTVNNGFNITCLPEATVTYAIGPYWGDQRTDNIAPNTGNGIFTSISGTAPNRIFNIEYRTVFFGETTATAPTQNYEVRLFEGQTSYDVIYGLVTPKATVNDSALTVGVQKNSTAGQFTQVGCDATGGQVPPVSTGQRYHYTLGGVCPTPTPSPSPTITPGQTPTPTPSPTCGPIVVNGSLAPGDPTQSLRLFRGGIAATCAAPLTCSTTGAGPYRYNVLSFTNTNSVTTCFTIQVDVPAAPPFIFVGAYSPTYDPTNICTNYLGDPGLSPQNTATFSVNVPAGAAFKVVVSDVNTSEPTTLPYTVTVTGAVCPSPTPGGTPTPTPTPTPTASATATPSTPTPPPATPSPTLTPGATPSPTTTPSGTPSPTTTPGVTPGPKTVRALVQRPGPAQAIELDADAGSDRKQRWDRRVHHHGEHAEACAPAGDRTFVDPLRYYRCAG